MAIDGGSSGEVLLKDRDIPLGTLSWPAEHDRGGASRPLPAEWEELSADGIIKTAPRLTKELTKLVSFKWIRVTGKASTRSKHEQPLVLRVYVLPDDVGKQFVDRTSGKLRTCLRALFSNINATPEAWADQESNCDELGYQTRAAEDDSLFYIFNTLPSPQPMPDDVEDGFAANAMLDLLDGRNVEEGLKTMLYNYQRRSAALMVQRETQPEMCLDPRLETWLGPTGERFYLDRDKCVLLSAKRQYPAVRGGILAETMGYGKTLICLAVILATKGYLPAVPLGSQAYFPGVSKRRCVAPLTEICALVIAKNDIQWRVHFQQQEKQGKHYKKCTDLLDNKINRYSKEVARRRQRRDAEKPPEFETMYIASTTLVVVPPNLLQQWHRQIQQHLRPEALAICIIGDSKTPMPASEMLRLYDVVLLSSPRFEEEINPRGKMSYDTQESLYCLCSNPARRRGCSVHLYRSPLRNIHFLRLIVDEGQRFVSASTTQAMQGLKQIKVERKWIVSGTPAGGLVGAEVDLAAEESSTSKSQEIGSNDEDGFSAIVTPDSESTWDSSDVSKLRRTLDNRKTSKDLIEERKAIERLGHIAKSFLGAQPWSSEDWEDMASWNTYVLPRKDGERKPLSLRSVLSSLIVRHQYEDVEADLRLPPLENKLVYLEPCYHDKLSINLFLFSLLSNAITSERTDLDYMFHPRNRKFLEALIKNLRHACFAWSGFKPKDIEATCNVSRKYLENNEKQISDQDRADLLDALSYGDLALQSPVWNAFHDRGEIGLYVTDFFPIEQGKWAFCPGSHDSNELLLISPTQLRKAQEIVDEHLYAPTYLGITKSLEESHTETASKVLKPSDETTTSSSDSTRKSLPSKGIPQSGLQEVKRFTGPQFRSIGSLSRNQPLEINVADSFVVNTPENKENSLKSILKSYHRKPEIPPTYPELSRTKIIGTSSAKLSYLLDQILLLYQAEKILVFYEGDDIAYYIAQSLELLNVPHLIYASGISQQLRNQYQTHFNTEDIYRVLLMDLKQAALGLHLASASRVFFINPVWQPTIEAQAIKRAHRIGQTKPVFVETLVLKDTIESAMLERRKDMTSDEHQKASRSLLDDHQMKSIIQQAKLLSIENTTVKTPAKQFAPLLNPQQIFARGLLSVYGTEEMVTKAWHQGWGQTVHAKYMNEETQSLVNDENGIANIIAAHPEILREGNTSPDLPVTEEMENLPVNTHHASKKAKINYVDELEKRKTARAIRREQKGHSGIKSFAGVTKKMDQKTATNYGSKLRRVIFADEKDLPLVTITSPPKESPLEVTNDTPQDVIMTGM